MIERIESLCVVSKDGFASRSGEPIRLRGWQKQLILRLFARRANGRLRHRVALIGMPRKNGKSAIGSGFALDGLLFGGNGAEVYSAAAEKEQARIVFGETKKMVAAVPDVADLCKPMKDVIEVPSTGSIYRVLSAEAYSKEGLNPSRTIIDELHAHPTDELFNVLTLASAGRIDAMHIAITTAGVMAGRDGRDSVCYRLYKMGKDIAEGMVDDPSFFMAWWGAPDGADHLDPAVWEAANPGFGDIIDPEDFESAVLRTPENEFRTKRLNQWVASETAWLPSGVWDECKVTESPLHDGDTVFLGFDGSRNGDSTALVVVRPGSPPFVDLVKTWDKPPDDEEWDVPVEEVEEAIRAACKRWRVKEILADPYLWQHSLQLLAKERLPVVEFPQTPARMIPATQRFYEAVLTRQVAHNGNEVLARHLRAAVIKTNDQGSRIVKESKGSGRKIDAALAAVIAFHQAALEPGASPAQQWLEAMVGDSQVGASTAEPEPQTEAPTGPESAAPQPASWSPWGQSPSAQGAPETRAALSMLRQMGVNLPR